MGKFLSLLLAVLLFATQSIVSFAESQVVLPTQDQISSMSHISEILNCTDENIAYEKLEELKSLSASDTLLVIAQIAYYTDNYSESYESLIPFIPYIYEKLSEIDAETIADILSRSDYSGTFKIFLMDFAENANLLGNYNVYSSAVTNLANNKDAGLEERIYAIRTLDSKDGNILPTLKELYNSSDNTSQKAMLLKHIGRNYPTEAKMISKDILNNYQLSDSALVTLANKSFIRYMDKNSIDDQQFIVSKNREILSNKSLDNSYVQGCIFSLAELESIEAPAMIFDFVEIEDQPGMHYFVENNFDSLISYLSNEDFSKLERCIYAVPSEKFTPVLNSMLNSRSNDIDRDKIESLLTVIETADTVSTAGVAVGSEGYAAYRDGVAVIEWHAGLVSKSEDDGTPIEFCHNPGDKTNPSRKGVIVEGRSGFLGGKNPTGLYKRNVGTRTRANIVDEGLNLTTEGLGYTLFALLEYEDSYPSGPITPSAIVNTRCDGTVEYCYEVWGVRLMGPDNLWDISTTSGCDYHNSISALLTPKSQAQDFMTQVTSSF